MASKKTRRVVTAIKLSSLRSEIGAWRAIAASDAFSIHRTQLEDVCQSLEVLYTRLAESLPASAGDDDTLDQADADRFDTQLLGAFRIWEFYRSKFALRLVEPLRTELAPFDELAWQAYQPARNRAVASGVVHHVARREPPLVFTTPERSAFARPHGFGYEIDETGAGEDATALFDDILRTLPVPLIGVPHYQLAHLPHGIVVAHEAGHLVEDDFDLTGELQTGIADALRAAAAGSVDETLEERIAAWSIRWRSETFADVYAVLVGGPAYADVLLGMIDAEPSIVAEERQPDLHRAGSRWSTYPTRALRALVVCEAVRQLADSASEPAGFAALADTAYGGWAARHPTHAMTAYERDVPHVVRALMHTPLRAFKQGAERKPIVDVVSFTPQMDRRARRLAVDANGGIVINSNSVRTLFAAAVYAFSIDPDAFAQCGLARFQKNLQKISGLEVRDASAPLSVKDRDKRHAAIGQRLYERLVQDGRRSE
ncbi:MAG TPA: hypothetical protein VN706_05450 [Gemmatimonadaceae bacterium]|nr:hypothetical protein [Gemmatimonadaceae bacterium]